MIRETGISIPGQVIQKTKKMVLDAFLLHTQHYKVKWCNPGKGVTPSLHLSVVTIKKGAFGSPSTTVANFIYLLRGKTDGFMSFQKTLLEVKRK